jgi:hypothetical protein
MEKLLLLPVSKPDKNKLEEAYEVAEDAASAFGSAAVKVPKFFQYDGASVPPMAWQVIGTPFQPRFMVAAVFHDWLYHTHQVDRKAANDLFYDLLIASGVRETKAAVMLAAVETFGGWYWKNDPDDRDYLKRLAERIKKDGRNPADYGISG